MNLAAVIQRTQIIAAAHPNLNGHLFTVVLTNTSGGLLRSSPATLTVLGDHEAPRLVSASGQANLVILRFSEPVDVASAAISSHYTLREIAGPLLQILSATP